MDISLESPAVLVVDDEPLIRMDFAATIEDAGFRVYEAGNADDALALLESGADIKVIVTDVDMPGSMNGTEFAHYAHAFRPLKIIVASGKTNGAARDLPPGAVFLAKPLAAIRSMVDARYWLEAVASDGTVKILASAVTLEIISAAYWDPESQSRNGKLQVRFGEEIISLDARPP
jgi:two-component system, response regulator PdtaR